MILAKWINRAALGLVGVAALLFLLTFFAYIQSASEPEVTPCHIPKSPIERVLPAYALPLKPQHYEEIGSPLLQTKWTPITLQLPDLRTILFYYGINSRPDAKTEAIRLQFGVGAGGGSTNTPNTLAAVSPNEPLYLIYDKSQGAGRYLFSANNQPTNLWIVAQPEDNSVKVDVFLQDEEGNRVKDPAARLQFNLPQKELTRSAPTNWLLGTLRVDGTLLARQKARWYGQDMFLNDHGGPEYTDIIGKERIEFGEGPERYVVYLGPNSCLIWKDQRWQPASSVADSTTYPLLCVKKIEERLLRLELWDVEGKARVPLTLLRSTETWNPKALEKDFVFTAPRTLSQYIFTIRKERAILRMHDWFVLSKEGWKKLITPQQIDAFVDEREPGVLFIFEGPKEKGGVRILSGMLYNATRSAKTEVEFPLDHPTKAAGGKKTDKNTKPAKPAAQSTTAAPASKEQKEQNVPVTPPNRVEEVKTSQTVPSPSTNRSIRPIFPHDEEDDDDDEEDFDEIENMWMERGMDRASKDEQQKFFQEMRR